MKLKAQQHEILLHLYRFRFLSRPHIQRLLNHKNHSRILTWLNELTHNEYIHRYYERSIQSIPAVYSLAPKGRRYLRENREETKAEDSVLSRVWREKKFSEEFRRKRLIIADIYLSLRDESSRTGKELHFRTSAEYKHFEHMMQPAPDIYLVIGGNERYFLDVFGDIPPRIMRSRVDKYIDYCDEEEWQTYAKKPFPKVVLVCPNGRLQTHIKRYIRTKMERSYTDDLKFYLITSEQIRAVDHINEAFQLVDTTYR